MHTGTQWQNAHSRGQNVQPGFRLVKRVCIDRIERDTDSESRDRHASDGWSVILQLLMYFVPAEVEAQ